MLEDGFFDRQKPLQLRRGALPHWRQDGALYFVTFRLSDSLPQSALTYWRDEWEAWRQRHRSASREEVEEFTLQQRRRIERWLDRGIGSCVLRPPRAREIVDHTLRHFNGERYELGEYTIAPNHVHALVRTAPGIDLSAVLHSWKRYSARELRRLDGVRSKFPPNVRHLWQVESFDHIVRNRIKLDRFTEYIRNHENASGRTL